MNFLLLPSLKNAQVTWEKGKTIKKKIKKKKYSVGHTENHELISVIIPKGYR